MSNSDALTLTIAAIRDVHMAKPAEQISPQLIGVCDRLLTPGMVAPDESAKQKAWARLSHQIAQRDAHRLQRARRLRLCLILIIAFIVLFTMIAYATGLLPWLFRMGWSHEQVSIAITMEVNEISVEAGGTSAHEQTLIDALAQHNMSPQLPSWLPTGYTLDSVKGKTIMAGWEQVIAKFRSEQDQLILQVDRMDVDDGEYAALVEKDTEPIDLFEQAGQHIAIYENLGYYSATYSAFPYRIEIAGDGITRQQLHQIIKSIGGNTND